MANAWGMAGMGPTLIDLLTGRQSPQTLRCIGPKREKGVDIAKSTNDPELTLFEDKLEKARDQNGKK